MTTPVKNYTPSNPRLARRMSRTHPENHHLMMTGALLRLAKKTGNTSVAAKTKRVLEKLNSGMIRKIFK